jgi:hypothetical protein
MPQGRSWGGVTDAPAAAACPGATAFRSTEGHRGVIAGEAVEAAADPSAALPATLRDAPRFVAARALPRLAEGHADRFRGRARVRGDPERHAHLSNRRTRGLRRSDAVRLCPFGVRYALWCGQRSRIDLGAFARVRCAAKRGEWTAAYAQLLRAGRARILSPGTRRRLRRAPLLRFGLNIRTRIRAGDEPAARECCRLIRPVAPLYLKPVTE